MTRRVFQALFCSLGILSGALSAQEAFQFTWNPYATHQPVLYKIAKMTTGPIVEFGCGDGSTDMLHSLCKASGRLLISIDHDKEWLSRYTNKYLGDGYSADNSGWHKFILVPKHEGNTILEDWILFLDQCSFLRDVDFDVCFVDQSPGPARTETILRLKDRARYIILHDCDMYVASVGHQIKSIDGKSYISQEIGHQIKPMDRQNQIPGIYDFSETFSTFKVYFPPRPWAGPSGPPTLLGSNFEEELPDVDFMK